MDDEVHAESGRRVDPDGAPGQSLRGWEDPAGHGYSLQSTRKVLEGRQHPDRDAQFRYINGLVADFLAAGDQRGYEEEGAGGACDKLGGDGRRWRSGDCRG